MGSEETLKKMQFINQYWKWWVAAGGILLILGIIFIIHQNRNLSESNDSLLLWQFSENDVSTKIEVRKNASGQLALLGTFVPTREHFHLYSKDLPEGGLDGLGRPTLLKVISSNGIKSVGSLTSNQPVEAFYIQTLDLSFPVYPDGPVTLSLPFELAAEENPLSMELSVTYMACSDKTCLPPVIDKRLTTKIPPEIFHLP
jgi:hypothetical protein